MRPNKSEKICCEYIKDGECTLNEREKADCCPKNGLYTQSQVDEITSCLSKIANENTQKREVIIGRWKGLGIKLERENRELKAKLKEQEETKNEVIDYWKNRYYKLERRVGKE